jgi:hypothetical protein
MPRSKKISPCPPCRATAYTLLDSPLIAIPNSELRTPNSFDLKGLIYTP